VYLSSIYPKHFLQGKVKKKKDIKVGSRATQSKAAMFSKTRLK